MPKSIAIIKLPLVATIGEERVAAFRQLDAFARCCDQARNYALRAWARWREDREEMWSPPTKVSKAGNEYEKNEPLPRYIKRGTWEPTTEDDPEKRSGQSFLYWKIRERFPDMGTQVVTLISSEVWKKLRAKVPWRPGLIARTVAQSVMTYENAIPTFRGGEIPVRYSTLKLSWDDKLHGVFSLWPKGGREAMHWELRCTRLPASYKNQIRRAIAGEDGHRLADSYLKRYQNRWYLYLCVHIVNESDKLDPERVLTFTAADRDSRHPFWVGLPNGREFQFGTFAKALETEWRRLVTRRKTLRFKSRSGMARGRGNGRFYRQLKTGDRRWHHVCGNFQKVVSADLRKLCREHNCGTLVYRPPKDGDKENTWFGERDVPFFWEEGGFKTWVGRLKNFGIQVEVKEREKCPEIVAVST